MLYSSRSCFIWYVICVSNGPVRSSTEIQAQICSIRTNLIQIKARDVLESRTKFVSTRWIIFCAQTTPKLWTCLLVFSAWNRGIDSLRDWLPTLSMRLDDFTERIFQIYYILCMLRNEKRRCLLGSGVVWILAILLIDSRSCWFPRFKSKLVCNQT